MFVEVYNFSMKFFQRPQGRASSIQCLFRESSDNQLMLHIQVPCWGAFIRSKFIRLEFAEWGFERVGLLKVGIHPMEIEWVLICGHVIFSSFQLFILTSSNHWTANMNICFLVQEPATEYFTHFLIKGMAI